MRPLVREYTQACMARVPFRMIFSCVGVQHGGCRPDLGPGAVTEYTILLNAISIRWTSRLGFHVTVRRGVRGMAASGVPGGTEGAGIGVRSDGFEGVDDAARSSIDMPLDGETWTLPDFPERRDPSRARATASYARRIASPKRASTSSQCSSAVLRFTSRRI
jgi:hypothetical protein